MTDTFENCECSTLYYCLKWNRLSGGDNAVSAQRIDGSGLFEQLFGDESALEVRSLGNVVTSFSLDWALEKQLSRGSLKAKPRVVENEANRKMNESKQWLVNALTKSGQKKGVALSQINTVIAQFSKAFALDVKGKLKDVTGCEDYETIKLLSHLEMNAKESLVRRQKGLFDRLVFECLLPFYSELEKMGALRACGAGTKIRGLNPPDKKQLLRRMHEAGDHALIMGSALPSSVEDGPRRSARGLGTGKGARTAREANVARHDKLYQDVMVPKCKEITKNAVLTRFENDGRFDKGHFESYRRKRSHSLGNDLKSASIERTNLKDLVMPEIAQDSVYPLQQALREMKDDAISEPQRAMQQVVVQAFEKPIQDAIETALDDNFPCALARVIIPSLQKSLTDQIFIFDTLFTKLLATLPRELMRIIKTEFTKSLAPVAKANGNQYRVKVLGDNANAVATTVSSELLAYVRDSILDVMHAKFRESFKQTCIGTHALFDAAVNGDTKDLERLEEFKFSQHYSRFAAGIIVAVGKSGLAKVDNYPNYKEIQKIAEQPSLMRAKGETLKTVINIDDMGSEEADQGTAADGQSMVDEWTCPCCGAAQANVDMRAINLGKVLSQSLKLDPSTEYCKLCLLYFKRWKRPRPRETEQKRSRDRKRLSLDGDGDGGSARKAAKMSN